MTNNQVLEAEIDSAYVYTKTWKDKAFFQFCHKFAKRKTAVVGLVVIVIMAFCAIFAPMIAPYDYTAVDPIHAFQSPSGEHWFGTDVLGRDIFSRMLYGGRYSLSISLCSEGLGFCIAVVIGAIAGYFGGLVENVILRLCDVLQSLPSILLCIVVSQCLGTGLGATIIALSISGIPTLIRLLRSSMISVRELEYVEAARAINAKKPVIMFKHVVSNCLAPVLVASTGAIGYKIITSASLSFLGLGIQEPMPEWGAMIAAGKAYFRYHPFLVIIPGIVIAVCCLSLNLIGDGVRDALDPKLNS